MRFKVALLLGQLAPITQEALVNAVVRPCLLELVNDVDSDVRHFAIDAAKRLD